jgi:hypothetical protein
MSRCAVRLQSFVRGGEAQKRRTVPFTANACSTYNTINYGKAYKVVMRLTCSEFSVSSALRFAGAFTDMLCRRSDQRGSTMGRGSV